MTTGRAVLITGSARGIGAACAHAFAEQGDRIAVHCRADLGTAQAVADSLPGSGHVVIAADLADPDECRRLVREAVEGLGGLDVLVNNAAVYDDGATGSRRLHHPPLETSFEQWVGAWQQTLAVNLLGTAHVSWCAARHMVDAGVAGRIVNVGSRGAYRGEPDVPAYGASKAGVHALGQSLAVALAPHGIGIASVAPGFVRTDMTAALLDSPAGAAISAQSPFGRVADAAEIAAAVRWLASPEALWASGAVLDLNGASHLR